MENKKINVSEVMKNIIHLGGEIMSNYSTESLDLKEITPEVAKSFNILLPLSKKDNNVVGWGIVVVEKIDLYKSVESSLSCGKDFNVSLDSDLLKKLLLLKLYSEDLNIFYTPN